MMTQVDARNWEQDNHRARKVVTNRVRGLMRKRQSPRQLLAQNHQRVAKTVGCWMISEEGGTPSLFLALKHLVKQRIIERERVSPERKRAALRSLQSVTGLLLTRLSRRGATVGWDSSNEDPFEIPIRESDCRGILCQNRSLDDWQWILNRSVQQQQLICMILEVYPSLSRRQIRELLKVGHTVYISPRVGPLFLKLENGDLSAFAHKSEADETHKFEEENRQLDNSDIDSEEDYFKRLAEAA